MQIVLFEEQPECLSPISDTRSLYNIHLAGTNLKEAVSRISDSVVLVCRSCFEKNSSIKLSGDVLFLNARTAPDIKIIQTLEKAMPRNSVYKIEGSIVAVRCPASRIKMQSSPQALVESLSKLKLKPTKLKLKLLSYPWEVVQANIDLIKSNLEILKSEYKEFEPGVFIGKGVSIDPTAQLNSKGGPIIIGKGSMIRPFTVLEGPLFIGPDSKIHPHAWIRGENSLESNCKVGGELEASVFQSYSNKQHFGFIGHSYIGSWVNIGAGTANSDLKNTYGVIKVKLGPSLVDTGLQFFGCVIGDYCKTAINSSILTGKIIGVCSHLYGVITDNVPAFTNYARDLGNLSEFYLESAIETQKRMFGRRGKKQSKNDVALLKAIHEATTQERRKAGVPKQRLMFR